jgi:hypothetical protein
MDDFSRYLPLSQRKHRDESDVTGDRTALISSTLQTLAAVVQRLDSEAWERVASDVADLSGRPSTSPADAAAALLERADSPVRRRSNRELESIVVAAYDVARSADIDLALDPLASGAVAVAAAARSGGAIRSILRTSTFVATDADWRVGSGPVVDAPASAIVLFLYGRGDVPGR